MRSKKIKLFLCAICVFMICSCTTKKVDKIIPMPEEVSGIWFSYIDFGKTLQGKNDKEISNEIDQIIEDCVLLNINTIYLHTTSFTDAFYDSKIYPKNSIVKDVDPLKIFIEKAHKKNIRVEAWINPMRSVKEDEINTLNDSFIVKQWIVQNDERIRNVEGRYYLNPAYSEVQDLIVSVVEEIINNYTVDGIHMDDYFYPEGADEHFDSIAYSMLSEGKSISEFRKGNVNQLVEKIYKTVKEKNNDLVFGISPSGNIEYSRDRIYGDISAWIEAGTIDYLVPQIYWGYTHAKKPFYPTLKEWEKLVSNSDIDLIIGLAAYKLMEEGKNSDTLEWNSDEEILIKQIQDSRDIQGYKGISFYAYNSLFLNEKHKEYVENQIGKIGAEIVK